MSLLFEPVAFSNKPLVWSYGNVCREPMQCYYHWHQCCEILIVHQGCGVVCVNSQSYEIRRGMLFFFQPFELHKVYAHIKKDKPYVRTVIHLDPVILANHLRVFPRRYDLFVQLWKAPAANRAFDLTEGIGPVEELCGLYDRACKNGIGNQMEEISLLILQLLSSIQYDAQDAEYGKQTERRPGRYSERIMNWLGTHYQDEFVLDRLAADLHLSKFYVSRLFREETGSSITEYLTARRIMQACHLLDTSALPVERIGVEVGLPNTSHFIHTFKKVVGLTPLKYRLVKAQELQK
ncbi:AraC family transcriptional regulator [Paenibacillus alkalitolerans]|uniref:AraC family transcriptional regulator n=1 Tax=Paenibacillus alkalitolerans TaxID=2799335 RepID=UPI0018F3519C|nr:AraC family transcriptional regulator [Paenibacillus alkalitolerans]